MTEILIFDKTGSLRKAKAGLEKKLNVSIYIEGKKITIEGEPADEYEALIVLNAISFGFSPKKALLLTGEGIEFRKINIKDFTRRKNLQDVRARIIGAEGKTKHTIESITGCDIMIKNNEAGIIGPAEHIRDAVTAIANLAKGTKQANVYRFLERMNVARREITDLGLKPEKEE